MTKDLEAENQITPDSSPQIIYKVAVKNRSNNSPHALSQRVRTRNMVLRQFLHHQ